MGKFLSFKAASDELDNLKQLNADLTSEVEAITADRASLAETVADLTEKLSEADDTAAENAELLANSIAANVAGDERTEELANELAEASAKLETFDDRVSESAREMVASLGHEALELPADDEPQKDIVGQYRAITDPGAKQKFYEENKAAIIATR